MPFTIERSDESDVIVVRGSGPAADSDGDDVVRALEQACDTRPSARVVLDVSGLDFVPTAAAVRRLAERLVELAAPRQCLMAVVARPGVQYGVARMLEALSSLQDVTAAAFSSLEEALAWIHLGASDA